MANHYDEHTINEFVAESRDHLEAIEPDLLAMEQAGPDTSQEILNRVFRAIHSVKGSSGFFHFRAIMELSHLMENVLMLLREGEITPDSEKIDALLCGVDKLRFMFSDPLNSDRISCSEEFERLNAILKADRKADRKADLETQGTPPASKEPEGPGEIGEKNHRANRDGGPPCPFDLKDDQALKKWALQLDHRELKRLQDEHHYLYALRIVNDRDLKKKGRTFEAFVALMNTYGLSLCGPGDEVDGPDPARTCLYSTLMEKDLLTETLDIEAGQVRLLDKKIIYAPAEAVEDVPTKAPPQQAPTERSCNPSSPQACEKGSGYETIRVNVEVIDSLMNLAGELVLGRNQLRREFGSTLHTNPKIGTLVQTLDSVTSEMQEKIMQMRLQPVGNLFNKFPRIVRDISRKLEKEVTLQVTGREVELDKTILEVLSDPMTHLIRNALDHGIELPAERERLGKDPVGMIRLEAFHEAGQVNIVMSDDGQGMNPDTIAEKAVQRNLSRDDITAKLSEQEKLNLIFLPGFSTVDTITDISGRGVGMDVVKTNIEKLGGHLDIESEAGSGTTVRIRLPLTLAIIPSLIVGASGHRFAVPQVNVKELVRVRAGDTAQRIEMVGDAEVLRLRGSLLPLLRLSDVLDLERFFTHPGTGVVMQDRRNRLTDRRAPKPDTALKNTALKNTDPQGHVGGKRRNKADRRQSWHSDLSVVILRMGLHRFGLAVDDLYDTEEIVVKPLSKHIKECKCFAGATIMGDGTVAMILDAAGIADFKKLRFSEIGAEERRRREAARKARSNKGDRKSVLLFNNAPDEFFAMQLEKIARLEKIKPDAIHRAGGSSYMDYRGEGLSLIYLDRILPVKPVPRDTDELFVIIPKLNGSQGGIVVSKIVDAIETDVTIKQDPTTPPGIEGSAFVQGRLTQFLNPGHLLELLGKKGMNG